MSQRFRKRMARVGLALTMAVAAMAVFAGAAQAASEHPFIGALDGSETEAGYFEYSTGVAVDPNGYLYVASYSTSRINVFNPDHEYVTSMVDEEFPCQVAVDSEGNVYVVDPEFPAGGEVLMFEPSSYPPTSSTTYTGGYFLEEEGTAPRVEEGAREGVAVNPANDHVFVSITGSNAKSNIREYKSVAEGSELVRTTFDPRSNSLQYGSVGVYGATGEIYAVVDDAITIFNEAHSEILGEIKGSVSQPLSDIGPIAVDQSNGNVLVSQLAARGVIDEFEPDGTLVSEIGPTFGESLSFVDSVPSGLAVDNSSTANAGRIYVGSGEENSVYYEFGPLVTTQPLTVIKSGTGSGSISSSPAGIDCGATCSAEFAEGASVTLTASAAAGSAFTGWSGCTSEAEAGKKCLVTIGATNAVTATFSPAFQLSVTMAGTGSGSVASTPAGIDCGSTCSAEFEEGEEVTLSATAASGSTFAGWSGACTGTGACKVTMSAAKAVTATFTAQSSGGGGGGGGGNTTPPPPAPTCATDATLCPPGTASTAAKAQVKSGKAQLALACPGPGACAGKVTLAAKITSGKGKHKKTKKQTIGSASFSIAPGGSATVAVKLSGPAKSALAKGTLKATISGTGLAPGTVKLSSGGGK